MKIKYAFFWVLAFILPIILIEGASRMISYPGSFDYIERRLIEQDFEYRKKPGEFRIFLLGESTIHGHYLFPVSTIDRWMKMYLAHLLPSQQFQKIKIYNLGRLGEDSLFIARTFFDILPLNPDLVVFYTSHNDFIQWENRRKNLSRDWKDKLYDGFIDGIKKSAFISGLRRTTVRRRLEKSQRHAIAEEIPEGWYDHIRRKHQPNLTEARLKPGGAQSRTILRMLENNIERVIRQARHKKIPVAFFAPLSRFDAYEPFLSLHAEYLTGQPLNEWQQLHDKAEAAYAQKQFKPALILYKRCLDIDPQYALTYFKIGSCYKNLLDYKQANRYFRLANDRDHFPIRAPAAVTDYYRRLSRRELDGIYVIDTQRLFEDRSPNGLIDISLVIDQMHPTLRGQALMAEAICRLMDEQDLLSKESWPWHRLPDFKALKAAIPMDDAFRFRAAVKSADYVGSYYESAINFLNQALRIRPRSLRARSQLAWTLFKADRLKEAGEIYRALGQEHPEETLNFFKNNPDIARTLSLPWGQGLAGTAP